MRFALAAAGLAGAEEERSGPDGGPLHQQHSHGPRASLHGGPQRQEHGDRMEERGDILKLSGFLRMHSSSKEEPDFGHFLWGDVKLSINNAKKRLSSWSGAAEHPCRMFSGTKI